MTLDARLTALVLVVAALFAAPAHARAADRAETLEVAFTVRFGTFVRWDEERSGDPLRVCVFGDDAVVARFRQAHGRSVAARALQVATPDESAASSSCDIAFFAGEPSAGTIALLHDLRASPVLTVGNGASFIEHGGIIRLYQSGNRMRFEISQAAARQAGLRLSSKLLHLAAGA